MSKQILVYVCRHGRTTLNKDNCFRGPIDAPLDSTGWRDANTLGHYFSEIELSHIFCSTKQRAVNTAEKIAESHNLPVIQNENLTAWNVGDFGGQEKTPENIAAVEAYVDNPDVPIPGGESLNNFKARVRPMIEEAIEIAVQSGVPTLIVAHSSVIHEIGSILYGDHNSTLVSPGGCVAIYIENDKLEAEPIFKPLAQSAQERAANIT